MAVLHDNRLRWIIFAVAALSAFLLAIRGVVGPFRWMHNPVTAECALAISVILALVTSRPVSFATEVRKSTGWAGLIFVFMAAAIAYLPILSMPLVTDDYIHMRQISLGQAPTALGCLTHSCGGPQFFRPIGFATYRAEWELWHTAALPRHAFDLILHAVSSVLFLLLVRRLGVPPPFDWLAGLLFAWNGIHVEAITGGRFDTLVLMFSLVAALCVLRAGRGGFVGSVIATAAACLTKESAYVLPILLALVVGRKAFTRAGGMLVGLNFITASAIFIWRWIVLGGIGGYTAQDGSAPAVLQFRALALAKTFLARIWGVLWFPVNWSRSFEWWMMLGFGAGLIGTCLLLRSQPELKRLILCVAAVAVACVPTCQMLLIGPSLERSRYLELAAPAFVLLLTFGCLALSGRAGIAALALLAAFQLGGLEHNLRISRSVTIARYELCRSLAERARKTGGRIFIDDVPVSVDGVYWRNGLEDCLWLEFGIAMGTVQVNQTAASFPVQ